MRRRTGIPSGKPAKMIARAVVEAGGSFTITANGHLKVQGPAGVAVVGVHQPSPRAVRNAVRDIHRYAGLVMQV